LGETYLKGADHKQAQEQYKQIIKLFPDSVYIPQALNSLGWSYFEETRYTEAKEKFLQLIKRFPKHPLSEDATFKLGEIEFNTRQFSRAVVAFKNYIKRYGKSSRKAKAYFYIAEATYFLQDFLTAITYYAKAADLAYDHKLLLMAKISMGWSYLKLERYDLSQKLFDEAYQLAKEKNLLNDDIFLGQATLYFEQENYPPALKAYTQLIELYPNSPRIMDARLGKANIYYLLEDYTRAIREYILLTTSNPTSDQEKQYIEKATFGLAWTYLKAGQIDLAIASFQKIMEQTDNKVVKVSALTQMGDAYQDLERYEQALGIYDKIMNEYPNHLSNDYIQFQQGIVHLKLEKLESAMPISAWCIMDVFFAYNLTIFLICF